MTWRQSNRVAVAAENYTTISDKAFASQVGRFETIDPLPGENVI